MGFYQVWKQTRPLRDGEPMHSGVRESGGLFDTLEEAEAKATELNGEVIETKYVGRMLAQMKPFI